MELYLFINFFTVVKMRSRGYRPGKAEIPTSSNAKKVCLYLYKAVIKCTQENVCAESMQALVLQLMLVRSDHTQQKDVLPCILTQFTSRLLHFSTN